MAVGGTRGRELPGVIPVFPLPGVILLPGGHLPLNIFEPRYLSLVTDALGAGRLMAMVQPREAFPDPVPDDAEVYPVGCLGRIVSFSETDQGGFLITLEGVSRFRIGGEAEPVNGYRRVRADYAPFATDLRGGGATVPERERVLDAAQAYFRGQGMEADWSDLDKADDIQVVSTLAMLCPLAQPEKQALLECVDASEQAQLLITLLEMAAHERAGGGADEDDGYPTGGEHRH